MLSTNEEIARSLVFAIIPSLLPLHTEKAAMENLDVAAERAAWLYTNLYDRIKDRLDGPPQEPRFRTAKW